MSALKTTILGYNILDLSSSFHCHHSDPFFILLPRVFHLHMHVFLKYLPSHPPLTVSHYNITTLLDLPLLAIVNMNASTYTPATTVAGSALQIVVPDSDFTIQLTPPTKPPTKKATSAQLRAYMSSSSMSLEPLSTHSSAASKLGAYDKQHLSILSKTTMLNTCYFDVSGGVTFKVTPPY